MSPVEGDQLAQAGERVVFARGTTVELDEADDRGEPSEEAEARAFVLPCRGRPVSEVGATCVGKRTSSGTVRPLRRSAERPISRPRWWKMWRMGNGVAKSVRGCFPRLLLVHVRPPKAP